MIDGAWRTGEPGCFFIDEANRYNPVPHLGAYEATNPVRRAAAPPVRRLQPRLASTSATTWQTGAWTGMRSSATSTCPRTSSTTSSTSTSIRCPRSTRSPSASAASASASWASRTRSCGSAIPYDSPEGVEFGRKVHGVRRRRVEEGERAARQRARSVPRVGALHLGSRRNVRARCRRQAHASDADAPQLQRHHRRAHGHDLDHRRMLVGPRAAVRRCVHAQSGRRDDAGRERGLRRDREARRLVPRRARWRRSRSRARRLNEVPAKWQRVFVTANAHRARVAHPHAGGLPGALRLGDLQDDELRAHGHDAKTCARSTSSRTSSSARASRCIAMARATTRCCRRARPSRREAAERDGSAQTRKRELGELQGHAGGARTRRSSGSSRRCTKPRRRIFSAAPKRSRPDKLRGTIDPQGDAARHDVRQHHRGRSRPAVRGVRQARQGGRRGDGRCGSDGPIDLARAALGDSAHGRSTGSCAASRRIARWGSDRTRCSRCRTRSVSRSRSGMRDKQGVQQELLGDQTPTSARGAARASRSP